VRIVALQAFWGVVDRETDPIFVKRSTGR
jgi:hypothetical protein